jgi:precorrin-2 dehydrogenase/sirohydrochlorin ferrochelatase
MYPIFLNVKDKLCVVIGGGKVAERKIVKLIQEGAKIIVISKEVTQKIKELEKKKKIKKIINSEYKENIIPDKALLVFECTGNKKVAKKIKSECESKGILINSATYPQISDFFVPSSVKRGGIHISISTEGKCSAFSRALREKIEEQISPELSDKLKIISKIRRKLIKSEGKKDEIKDKFLLEVSRYALKKPKISEKTFLKYTKKKAKNYGIKL